MRISTGRPCRRKTRLPVVVFNRGSYVRGDFSPEVLMPGNRLARQGYLVIAPMLRGSGGAQGRDEMGGADLQDVFNLVPVIKEIPYADPARALSVWRVTRRHHVPAGRETRFSRARDSGVGRDHRSRPRIWSKTPARVASAPTIWPDFPRQRGRDSSNRVRRCAGRSRSICRCC